MELFSPLMGATFRPAEAKDLVRSLTHTDGERLSLEPEPDNEYDDHAVKVICDDAVHIGFVAKENNYELHEALLKGEEFSVTIVSFENSLKPTMLIQSVDG